MNNTCNYITILAAKIPCKPKMDGNNNLIFQSNGKEKNVLHHSLLRMGLFVLFKRFINYGE